MTWVIIVLVVVVIIHLITKQSNKYYDEYVNNLHIGDKWEVKNLGPKERLYITIVDIDFDRKYIKYRRDYWFNGTLCETNVHGRDFESFYGYLGISFASKIENGK